MLSYQVIRIPDIHRLWWCGGVSDVAASDLSRSAISALHYTYILDPTELTND